MSDQKTDTIVIKDAREVVIEFDPEHPPRITKLVGAHCTMASSSDEAHFQPGGRYENISIESIPWGADEQKAKDGRKEGDWPDLKPQGGGAEAGDSCESCQ